MRKSGLEILSDIKRGTHFCRLCRMLQDIIDILTPYSRAGLENNEFREQDSRGNFFLERIFWGERVD